MTSIRWLAATLVGLAAGVASAPAWAAASDYAFEPVSQEVRKGPGSELGVRLIHKPTGKPVEDAIVFRTRLDMSPGNMAGMTSEAVPESSTAPGVYKFRGDLTMAGGWALKVMAKVQGEPETVQGAIVFTAKERGRAP